jgi:hypothetical protein
MEFFFSELEWTVEQHKHTCKQIFLVQKKGGMDGMLMESYDNHTESVFSLKRITHFNKCVHSYDTEIKKKQSLKVFLLVFCRYELSVHVISISLISSNTQNKTISAISYSRVSFVVFFFVVFCVCVFFNCQCNYLWIDEWNYVNMCGTKDRYCGVVDVLCSCFQMLMLVWNELWKCGVSVFSLERITHHNKCIHR